MSLARKTLLLLCIVSSAMLCAAENMLKNADFSKLEKNLPQHWKLSAKSPNACRTAAGKVTLSGAGTILSQENLSITPDNFTEIRARVKGNGTFRIYVDWPQSRRRAVNKMWQDFNEDWRAINAFRDEHFEVVFSFVSPAQEKKAPRLVIEMKNGTLSFSDFVMTSYRPPEALGVKWSVAGASKLFKENNENTALLGFHTFNTPSAYLKNVKVKPNTWYELSYFARGGLKGTHRGAHRTHKVGVKFAGEAEARNTPWRRVPTDKYIPFSYRFKTPSGAKLCEIRFMSPNSTYIQRVNLKEYTPKALENTAMVIDSPLYRNSIYASHPVKNISGTVSCIDNSIVRGSAELLLKNRKIASAKLQKKNGRFVYSFDAAKLAVGDYTLNVRVYDKNSANRTFTEIIRKLPKVSHEVVIGQDQRFYVNGKLFFPIGCTGMVRNAGHAEKLYAAAHGMNLIVNTPALDTEANVLKKLDDLHKYGMKGMMMIYFSVTDEAFDDWKKFLHANFTEKIQRHPALFGINLVDEPYECAYPPEILEKCYKELRKVAPYIPVWINCGPPGTILDQRQFMPACDITGVDIYPVGGPWHSSLKDKKQTCVEKYSERMKEIAENRRAILMVLQGYSWGEDSWQRIIKNPKHPTLEDMRFMSYTACFPGIAGVEYYSLWGVTRPVFYDAAFRAFKELHLALPVILNGKVLSDKTDARQIRTRTFEYNNNKYLFVLNMTDKAQNSVKVSVPFSGKVNVIHEGRTLEAKNNTVTDDFKPYAVHIYAAAPLPPPLSELPKWNGKGLSPWRVRQELNLKDREGTPYTGKANWIWSEKGRHAPGSKVWLTKLIRPKKTVKKATVLIAADDAADLYVNGTKAGGIATWAEMVRLDITRYIKKQKESFIAVKAWDGRLLPCGFIAEIRLDYTDGTHELIISDDSWLALDGNKPRPASPADCKGEKAVIVATYGKGAWGSRVKLPKK